MDVDDKATQEEYQRKLEKTKNFQDTDIPIEDKNVTGNAASSLAEIDKQTKSALDIVTTVLDNIQPKYSSLNLINMQTFFDYLVQVKPDWGQQIFRRQCKHVDQVISI